MPLWRRCRSLIERVWPEGDRADLDAAQAVIEQFDQKDPGSTAFRYPVDRDGNRSLPTKERINLRHMAAVMERNAALLDACSMEFQVCLDRKWEAERDCQ
jgi:hypothetical protein